jgi:hypothetical protein
LCFNTILWSKTVVRQLDVCIYQPQHEGRVFIKAVQVHVSSEHTELALEDSSCGSQHCVIYSKFCIYSLVYTFKLRMGQEQASSPKVLYPRRHLQLVSWSRSTEPGANLQDCPSGPLTCEQLPYTHCSKPLGWRWVVIQQWLIARKTIILLIKI